MAHRILVNFPTNFGDTVLALPAFDRVCAAYPEARFTAIASPATKEFLLGHSFIDEVITYDKHMSLRQKIRFACSLKGRYEIMIDFKHTLLPLAIRAGRHTPLFIRSFPPDIHARQRYRRLVESLTDVEYEPLRREFIVSDEARARWDPLRLGGAVCVATSSNSQLKEYPYRHLKQVVQMLVRNQKVVLLGDGKAGEYYGDIAALPGVTDLCGQTSFLDVYYILSRCASVCLCVDSSILHLASYLDVPICALFGPSDERRYGPWSRRSIVLTGDALTCRPCQGRGCSFDKRCMDIDPGKVVESVVSLGDYENP